MPRGGSRPGAGRKPKARPESAKVVELAVEKAAAALAQPESRADGDISPLDYLLQVVRDSSVDQRVRIQAASIAAPFVHTKPAAGGKKEEAGKLAVVAAGRFAGGSASIRRVK